MSHKKFQKMNATLSRRDFIKVGLAASGGLLISFHLPGWDVEASLQSNGTEGFSFNAYLSIDNQGAVTITAPVPEIGQGVRTSLPMLIAEELEADWSKIQVIQADAGQQYEGRNQRAAGSNSIEVYWKPLREAGAVAREMLLQAAAELWQVKKCTCMAMLGQIVHKPTGRKLGYGAVAEKAAGLAIPKNITLKHPTSFTIIGKPVAGVDVAQIVNGSIKFGQDIKVDGMLYAVIERCPVYGGNVVKFNADKVMLVPGVRHVIQVEAQGNPDYPSVRAGVAIFANSTWAALKGRKALNVEWDFGLNRQESTERLHTICRELTSQPAPPVRNDGDVEQALTTASVCLDALYHVPFISHMPMETMNCVADVRKDQIELWVPTQMPAILQKAFARWAKLPLEAVILHVTHIGGGFGRRLAGDFVREAIQLSKAVGKPVHLLWTREDDIQQGFYRPFSYHRMKAGIAADGKLIAWLHRQAGTSRYAFRPKEAPGNSEFFVNDFPANLIPHVRLEYVLAPSNISRGLLRAPGNNALAFVKESFIDEIAHATRTDPLAFRLSLLGDPRAFIYKQKEGKPIEYIDTGRMRDVLTLVAEKANWGRPLPTNCGQGIAAFYTFNSYVAYVAEVEVDPLQGEVKVKRFVSAVDCGIAVNPDGVKAQVEGGIVDGLSATLYGEITLKQGQTQQSNFHDYKLLRLKDTPVIEVHILAKKTTPTGIGEAPYPPVAPALCNAIFAACGKRIRRLPAASELRNLFNEST